MAEAGIMTPSSSEQVAREAEIMLLRQMTRAMEGVNTEMQAQRRDINAIMLDVAVVKERQTANAELRKDVEALQSEVSTLKTRASQQDGAMTFAGMMKDFGPWLVSLVLLAWGLFGGPKPH